MIDLNICMNMIYSMVQFAFPLSILFVLTAKIVNLFMCFVFNSKINF